MKIKELKKKNPIAYHRAMANMGLRGIEPNEESSLVLAFNWRKSWEGYDYWGKLMEDNSISVDHVLLSEKEAAFKEGFELALVCDETTDNYKPHYEAWINN